MPKFADKTRSAPRLAAAVLAAPLLRAGSEGRLDTARTRWRENWGGAGALADLMEEYFRNWSLTLAEPDVAACRTLAEGKLQNPLNAVCRKAGVARGGVNGSAC